MSKTLTESATFTANVTCPVDGDARNAASVEVGLQALTNRTKYLNAFPTRGAYNNTACTDGNVNVDTSLGDVFKIPSTLTANRTYTLTGSGSIPAGSIKFFFRPVGGGVSAHTVTINAGTASVLSVSGSQFNCGFLWDGADWHVITFSTTGAATVTTVAGS